MPFGEEVEVDGTYRMTAQGYGRSDSVRQRFTGYQKDDETGLDFAEARMYQSVHGRFTAIDPLLASALPGNPQSWNRYIYVGNNPLFRVDRTGLIWGKNEAGQVRWFDKELGEGFTEFTPEAWQYQGSNGRIIQIDANSSNWSYIDPVEVVAETDPIQDLIQSTGGALDDSLTGLHIGARNAVTNGLNVATNPLGPAGAAAGMPNPLEIAPLEPGNARQAAYALIAETWINSAAGAGVGAAVAGPASAGSSLSVVPEATANVVPRTSSVLGHIFRNVDGHVNPVTNASQGRFINLFERVANNRGNVNSNVLLPGQSSHGVVGYAQTYRGGQVWVHVRGGRIFDAGVNRIPR